MGTKIEDPHEVGFTTTGWHVSRKTGYTLGALAVLACILVGVIVYHAGVKGYECVPDDGAVALGNTGSVEGKEDGHGNKKQKVRDVRLPTHLLPEKYVVKLVPFIIPDNYTIKGYSEAYLNCEQEGTNITLHIAEMTIDEDSVVIEEVGGGESFRVSQHKYDKDREFYIAQLDRSMKPGKQYVIKMHFTAILRDGLKGFYRSTYKNENGENRFRILNTCQI